MKPKLFVSCLCLFTLGPLLWAEETAASQPWAVMRFALGSAELTPGQFSETEAGMARLIAGRGGRDVVLLDLSLTSEESALLFEKLKAAADPAALTGDVAIGGKTISRETFAAIAAAAVVAIPSVVAFQVSEERKGAVVTGYKATLKTGFDFIRREGELTRLTRVIETMGYDPDRGRAVSDAVKTILPLFAYELASLQELKPKTSILALENGDVVIDRGGKEGVLLGAEFVVRGAEKSATGQVTVKEKGLILIHEVTEGAAVGTLRYADADVAAGDAVEEVPRLGLDLTPYGLVFIPWGLESDVCVYAGVRVTLAKGVHTIRPFVCAEFAVYPFSTYLYYFPVRPFVGVEFRLHLGRFEAAMLPMIGVEEWFALSPSATTQFMNFGLRGLIEISLLLSRDLKLLLTGGYEYWFGNRQGFLAGGGISIKL